MELPSDPSEDNLKSRLKECKRTPTFGIWHDNSEILGCGYILVSVKDFYDHAVFKSDVEIDQQHRVQAFIEEIRTVLLFFQLDFPVNSLALCSSSMNDQAASISVCLLCIQQMDNHLTTSSNITITEYSSVLTSRQPNSNVGLRLVALSLWIIECE